MKVSVIIPVYNAGSYLKACLDSLRSQTLDEVEFLLVLDCPTDGSDVVCREMAQADDRFRLISNDCNVHIGETRNRGLAVATGDYVAFMDDDDCCAPDMLEALWQCARSTDADVVYSLVRNTNPHDSTRFDLFPSADDKRAYALYDILSRGGLTRHDSLFNPILGALYRRDIAVGISFPDTRVYSAEDKYWNIRWLLQPIRVEWVNSAYYTHVDHASNEGLSLSYTGLERRGKMLERLYADSMQWAQVWRDALLLGLYKEALQMLTTALGVSPKRYVVTRRYLREAAWARTACQVCRIPKRGIRQWFQVWLLRQLR